MLGFTKGKRARQVPEALVSRRIIVSMQPEMQVPVDLVWNKTTSNSSYIKDCLSGEGPPKAHWLHERGQYACTD